MTSVPSGERVAVTTSSGLRPSIMIGIHSAIFAGSVVISMPANSGDAFKASTRFLMNSRLSAPNTRFMCGVELMNSRGLPSTP
ncbi:hypothetical protein MB84_16765 [Pandoraea oxalativorans]|uniref:Uncharacterized protein n=1 Tax=Pandoraea oxalativorans TaxID=573737 RepID=A0A0E3U7W1_9BURK|nr:hypothetical protein MB84_16765 [Pandoraea oxalativorans]